MMHGTPRDRRLAQELEHMHLLTEHSSFVSFEARPERYPEEYIVTFTCLGLVAEPRWGPGPLRPDWRRTPPDWVGDKHVAHIYLPAGYPLDPPHIRLKTPVYHPNIRSLTDGTRELAELADQLGGIEHLVTAFQRQPELQMIAERMFASYICVDGLFLPELGGNYSERSRLYDICYELGLMIMFQRYNPAHGLNVPAVKWTEWAEKQKHLLPIDNQRFLDKVPQPAPHIRFLDKAPRPPSANDDLHIQIIGESPS